MFEVLMSKIDEINSSDVLSRLNVFLFLANTFYVSAYIEENIN